MVVHQSVCTSLCTIQDPPPQPTPCNPHSASTLPYVDAEEFECCEHHTRAEKWFVCLLACWSVCVAQVAQLKEWVTDNRLEDDDYFKMSQASKTKKADWVAFVKQKLENAP